jgi:RimJ/RimL family protein N-acetyltransferase
MVLQGKNILLRALEREDLKQLHKWQNDGDIMRLARSYPDNMVSMEALENEYEKTIKGEDHEKQVFIIQARSGGKAIGWASIRHWGKKALGADIGLAIGEKKHWRKGYGTEVTKLLQHEVFEQLGLHRAEWWTNSDNKGSLALAKKLGFKEEGRLRDAVFYDNRFHDLIVLGLLREEYERIKPRN